jgi:hypothetical protein
MPVEADAPLVVDTDAISRRVGIFQLLKAISTWDGHVPEPIHRIELTQLAPCRALDVRRQLAAALAIPDTLSFRRRRSCGSRPPPMMAAPQESPI